MPEQAVSSEIGREADEHIALGLLLRQDRPEAKKSAVQKVLSSTLTTAQMVEKIRQIDETQDGAGILRVVRQTSAQSARGRVRRISHLIKKPVKGLSFLSFLFNEYGHVRRFGRRTHVLDALPWPPGVRLDSGLPGFLVKQVQGWAHELSPRLATVVEHGWLHLTPRQFNYVVLLKRLADRLCVFDFLHLDLREPNLVERFARIESLFLMLHCGGDALGTLITALGTFYEKQRDPAAEAERTQGLAARLLSEDITLPSLYNVLLGLNIVRRRRLLTLADLTQEGLGEMVDSRGFDVEAPFRARMETYIDESMAAIRKLHGQLQEARRINSFVPVDDEGRPDDQVLRALYRSADQKESFDYDHDQQNLVLFVSRLLHAFDTVFSPLLNGQCLLEGVGRAAIFARGFFELEFTRMRSLMERLDTGPFHFSAFPLQRHLQIKAERLGSIGNELDLSLLVDEAVGGLVDLGKTLTKVLGLRLPSGAANPAGAPLEPVVLQGKPFSLPCENALIRSRSLLAGVTVAEGITIAVRACFTAGVIFRDDFLSIYHGSEKRLAEELRQRMRLMETLLDAESYRDLSALYV